MMVIDRKSQRYKIIQCLAYLAPIAIAIWSVHQFSVNVPTNDQWDLFEYLFIPIHDGSATLAQNFFNQHNEHRILFPRIIFLILAFLSKWNNILENYFSIFLICLTFYGIYKISKVSNFYNERYIFMFNFLSCIFLFSLRQNNLFWGFQIAWFLINCSMVMAIFFLTVPQKLSLNVRLLLSAICCLIASFSSAHGLFSWIALLPSLAYLGGTKKQSQVRLILWLGLFISCCLIYSINYVNPGGQLKILNFDSFQEAFVLLLKYFF